MKEEKKNTTAELYKNISKRIRGLLVTPKNEWELIKEENKSVNSILSDFALPIMAVCAVAAFLGRTLELQVFNLEAALKFATIIFISLFGSIYIVVSILKMAFASFKFEKNELFALTVYSSSLWYVISLITLLIPEIFFLKIGILYSIYIINSGIGIYLKGNTNGKTVIISLLLFVLVHLIPLIIKYSLLKFVTL